MSTETSPRSSWLEKGYAWLDERLGLTPILAVAKKKTVPVHGQTFAYYWGGIALFLFIVQAVSGVLLLVYYRSGEEAYESVRLITHEVSFGWLVRTVHSWAANLMVLAVMIHMFTAFFMKAYRRPREFTWWSGVVLLLLTMTFGFSGYLLPMDELSFFATKVGLEIPASIPIVGQLTADILRAGPDVNPNTIQRFFALHVVVLPALFIPLLGLHLFLVQLHGMSIPPSEEAKPVRQRRTMPFFPNFLFKDLAMWLMTLCALSILAFVFPWELGTMADPIAPAPENIHPEWYFMSSFQVLKVFGRWFPGMTGEVLGMGIFTLGLMLWFLVPLYDSSSKSGRRGRDATYFGILALMILIITTIWGYMEVGVL